jgi:hypothetical protein
MDAAIGMFQVVPEELAALASSVYRLREQLDNTSDLVNDCTSALGSDVVALALHHFVTGWRDGRRQIAAELDDLSAMLTQASTTYAATDSELADAIPPAS